MTARACCRSETSQTGGEPTLVSKAGRRSLMGLLRWFVPSAVLAMMPKCPLCVATYYTLLTGLGMSLAVAVVVRNLLIVVCIGMLVVAVLGLIRKFFRRGVTVFRLPESLRRICRKRARW